MFNFDLPLPSQLENRAKAMLNATCSHGWNWEMVKSEWRAHYRREAWIENNYTSWNDD